MAKTDIKVCPYSRCPYPNHEVNIVTDSFVRYRNRYYHVQCREEEKKALRKSDQEKANIALFLDLWNKHISNTVNYGFLRKIINEYMERGISTDYLLFVLQYVISNRMVLNYPQGFKYYIDRVEIKRAYEKKQLQQQAAAMKQELAEQQEKRISEPVGSSNAPHFAIEKQASTGFEKILKKQG